MSERYRGGICVCYGGDNSRCPLHQPETEPRGETAELHAQPKCGNCARLEAEIAALRSMFRDALTHHWPHNENPLEKCIYCEAALATGNTQKSVRDPVESISGE